MYVYAVSLVIYGDSCKSKVNIQSSFSAECVRSLEEHTKKLEINLRDLLCPFIFVHK